ncbi:hypothetical protein EGJ27_02185 [Pseudomonas sp. v388]|uniref:pPIWI_RE module domain-containing protein n=1 Tax=Pseudomonas sp. v388 TaxID=2479849 RepID=UPI000F7A2446|nr:DUF3962 domain-containing protein [Pseudomonas sp. v388]RRV10454.1 hypothetical protein EGJ27_02185 [Pseudomonas sp. v388]
MSLQLRTNLLQFDPEELPPVYQFRATDEYCHGWKQLTRLYNKQYLPSAGLEEVLAALSGGPVWVNYKTAAKGGGTAIASLNPISYSQLCEALRIWAREITTGADEVTQFLRPEDAVHLDASTLFADPKQSEAMYKVVPWMLARQLTEQQMESSKPLTLSLCSDSTLLAWDQPLMYAKDDRRAIAMHAITTQLLLVHRRQRPYAAVGVHLSHILPQWRHPTHKVWYKTDRGISKFAIQIPPMKDGQFETRYSTVADRVLMKLGEPSLPPLGQGELELAGNLRPIHAHLPPFWPVGNGAGPLFLDQASFHFQKCVPSAKPMLTRYVGKLIASGRGVVQTPVTPIKVAVITAHTDIMARVAHVHDNLEDLTPVFSAGTKPEVVLQQVQRPGAMEALTTITSFDHLKQWFETQVLPVVKLMGAPVAIVETVPEVATKSDTDPKHILRTLFAKHGIATQFLFHITEARSKTAAGATVSSEPAPMDRKMGKRIKKLVATRLAKQGEEEDAIDYPAINGFLDAIRSTGYAPQPLQSVSGVPEDTIVLSIYLDHIRHQG